MGTFLAKLFPRTPGEAVVCNSASLYLRVQVTTSYLYLSTIVLVVEIDIIVPKLHVVLFMER